MTSPRIVVIGSGIAGASVAFGLAARSAAVTLIDDAMSGQATAAGAGIIAPWVSSSDGAYYETYAAGGAFYPELLSRLSASGITDVGYRRTGAIVVDRDPSRLAEAAVLVRERAAAAGAVAGEVTELDPTRLRRACPPIDPEMSGLLITGGGRVDGRMLRDGLLTAAAGSGAELVRDSVVGLTASGGSSWSVATASARVDCDAVVVAAGARSPEILGRLGHRVAIAGQRGQLIHLSLPGANTGTWPTVHPLGHHYITPFDSGRIVIGATREDGTGFDVRPTAAGLRQVLDDALAIAPGLAEATVLETRVGIRPMSQRDNRLPFAGRITDASGLWLASGFGAGGLTMGPLIGDAIARDILGEPAPEIAALQP
ncbi:D-amino-acid dehydrogenase [Brevibacterium sanguinis]|uniref:D-amino-acid dehydrogenase n=2 Tax=Brevibacterium TaxID=1696 RepID=A0A366IFC3_9MICO|nr:MULTISPECIES: FAD-dependent oxidoreductase [Brevibacterium]RBP62337.1 D-amino-acid dehydrogenase [Brevibacterium sanguinis]RBP68726.1 D-amino-acid dehydrogenase [Brevibacterium celere]